MIWWIRELFRSARFLTASGEEGFWRSKRVYELAIPLAFVIVVAIFAYIYPEALSPDILSKLASGLFQFMVFVVPFHLAALAAVATFTRPELDQALKGADVSIKAWDNKLNEYFIKSLTLRQYTCLLFGYLCSIGMAFILVYIIASGLNLPWIFGDYAAAADKIALLLLLFYLAHYGTLTIYAVTFLFDKVGEIDGR